jgi:hypothetical protein
MSLDSCTYLPICVLFAILRRRQGLLAILPDWTLQIIQMPWLLVPAVFVVQLPPAPAFAGCKVSEGPVIIEKALTQNQRKVAGIPKISST